MILVAEFRDKHKKHNTHNNYTPQTITQCTHIFFMRWPALVIYNIFISIMKHIYILSYKNETYNI